MYIYIYIYIYILKSLIICETFYSKQMVYKTLDYNELILLN